MSRRVVVAGLGGVAVLAVALLVLPDSGADAARVAPELPAVERPATGDAGGAAPAKDRVPVAGGRAGGSGPEPGAEARRDATRGVALRVVDAVTGEPLPGAVARAAAGGEVVARADGAGMLRLHGARPEQVVFVAEGYLARFPAAEREPPPSERVELQPDRFTVPLPLRFVAADGSPAHGVRFRLRRELPAAEPGQVPGAASEDPTLRRRWQSHVLAMQMPGFEDLLQHVGDRATDRVLETEDARATVRLGAGGPYGLQATSRAGEVAAVRVLAVAGRLEPIVVSLQPGRFLRGRVRSAGDGSPLAGAALDTLDVFVGVGPQRTGADGRFALGPLPPEPVAVWIEHPGHESTLLSGRTPGGGPITVSLQPLPRHVVHGFVRARPSRAPISGAGVELRRGGRTVATAETAGDGSFRLEASAGSGELHIEAPGYLEWVEVIEVGAAPASFELVPATREARMQAGLTGVVRGRVLGARGEAVPGVTVMATSGVPPGLERLSGRRVRAGGGAGLTRTARTDVEGRYEIECPAPDVVRLVVLPAGSEQGEGVAVAVAPGRVTEADLGIPE